MKCWTTFCRKRLSCLHWEGKKRLLLNEIAFRIRFYRLIFVSEPTQIVVHNQIRSKPIRSDWTRPYIIESVKPATHTHTHLSSKLRNGSIWIEMKRLPSPDPFLVRAILFSKTLKKDAEWVEFSKVSWLPQTSLVCLHATYQHVGFSVFVAWHNSDTPSNKMLKSKRISRNYGQKLTAYLQRDCCKAFHNKNWVPNLN